VVESQECKNKDVFIYVAGDDVVLWTSKKNEQRIRRAARELFSEHKEERAHGLGQCIE